ncbi:MAG: hypothetical protein QW228_00830 [Candidatus Aenigmatarchaeota archaeon]
MNEELKALIKKEGYVKMWIHEGLQCLALRHPIFGHWCGYVGIDKNHPLFGKEYNCGEMREIDVHGGITFAGKFDMIRLEKELWWIGFDCAHYDDYVPFVDCDLNFKDPSNYVTLDRVVEETNKLAKTLASWSKR